MQRLAWVLTPLVAGVAGGISYVFGTADPLVTASVAVSYAVVVVLSARHPDTVYEEGIGTRYGPWSAVATGFLLLAALSGVNPWLPIDDGLRLSLGLLVVGVGYAMWLFGVSYARAKATR
jgi:hypothetical protein